MVILGVLAIYLSVIVSESENDAHQIAFGVLFFLVPIACLVGTLTLDSASARGIVGAGAAGFLLSFSVLAVFSVGYLLLVATVLAIAWVVRSRPERAGSSSIPTIAAFVIGAILPWGALLA